jgi:hypothetical protein
MQKGYENTMEQLDLFQDFFKEIIEESMYSKLKEACNIPDNEEIIVSDVNFLPIYHRNNGKKTLKRMLISHDKTCNDYQSISVDELECTGASWSEFLDYLKKCGAKIVNPKTIY